MSGTIPRLLWPYPPKEKTTILTSDLDMVKGLVSYSLPLAETKLAIQVQLGKGMCIWQKLSHSDLDIWPEEVKSCPYHNSYYVTFVENRLDIKVCAGQLKSHIPNSELQMTLIMTWSLAYMWLYLCSGHFTF